MKLCERCASNAYGFWNHYNLGQREIVIVKDVEPPGDLEIVPETKCEFWAHFILNRLAQALYTQFPDLKQAIIEMGVPT